MRALVLILCLCIAAPAMAQSLLERVQGLYYPDLPGTTWDCINLGGDGGALAIRGNQMIGVENICELKDPVPIPGMDAVRYSRSCAGEGELYEADPVILTPTDRGVGLMFDGFVTEWLRCP